MFSFIQNWRIERLAEEHAAQGVYRPDATVRQLLGSRQELDPERHGHHARWLQDQTGTRLNDIQEVLAEREQAAAVGNHFSPKLIMAGVVFAVVVESFGGAYLMSSFGLTDMHRLLFGIAFGLGLIVYTAVVAHRSPPSGASGRPVGRAFLLLGYTVVIASVVLLRLSEASQEGNGLQAFAEAVIMLVATAGPPWMTELLMRRRSASRGLHTEMEQLRRDQREAARAQGTARRALQDMSRSGERWDLEAARLRDLYDTRFSLTRARLGLPPAGEPSPSDGPAYREPTFPMNERRLP